MFKLTLRTGETLKLTFLPEPHLNGCVMLFDVSGSMSSYFNEMEALARFGHAIGTVITFSAGAVEWDPERPRHRWGSSTNYHAGLTVVSPFITPGKTPLLVVSDGAPSGGYPNWRPVAEELKTTAESIRPYFFGRRQNKWAMSVLTELGTVPPQQIVSIERLIAELREITNPFDEVIEGKAVAFGAVEVAPGGADEEGRTELNELKDHAQIAAATAALTAYLRHHPAEALSVARYMKTFLSRFSHKAHGFQAMVDAFHVVEAEAGISLAGGLPGVADLLRAAQVVVGQTPNPLTDERLTELHRLARIAAANLPTEVVRGHARRVAKSRLKIQALLGSTQGTVKKALEIIIRHQGQIQYPVRGLELSVSLPDLQKGLAGDSPAFVAAIQNPTSVEIKAGAFRWIQNLQDHQNRPVLLDLPAGPGGCPEELSAALTALAIFNVTGQLLTTTWAPLALVHTLAREKLTDTKSRDRAAVISRALRLYVAHKFPAGEKHPFQMFLARGGSEPSAVSFAYGLKAATEFSLPGGLVALAAPLFIDSADPLQTVLGLLHESAKAADGYKELKLHGSVAAGMPLNVVELLVAKKPVELTVEYTCDLPTLKRCAHDWLTQAAAGNHPAFGLSSPYVTPEELTRFWSFLGFAEDCPLGTAAAFLLLGARLLNSSAPSSPALATALQEAKVQLRDEKRFSCKVDGSSPFGMELLRRGLADAKLPTDPTALLTLAQAGVDIQKTVVGLPSLPPQLLSYWPVEDLQTGFRKLNWAELKPSSAAGWTDAFIMAFLKFVQGTELRPEFQGLLAVLLERLPEQALWELPTDSLLPILRMSPMETNPKSPLCTQEQTAHIVASLRRQWVPTDVQVVVLLWPSKLLEPLLLQALGKGTLKAQLLLGELIRSNPASSPRAALERARSAEFLSLPLSLDLKVMIQNQFKNLIRIDDKKKVQRLSKAELYLRLVVPETGILVRNHASLRGCFHDLGSEAKNAQAYVNFVAQRRAREADYGPRFTRHNLMAMVLPEVSCIYTEGGQCWWNIPERVAVAEYM